MPRPDTTELQLFAERLTARSVLSEEERQAILTLPTHVIHVARKHDFAYINEETSYASLIASGIVGRFGEGPSGARQITAFHLPGDIVDLHSAVRPVGIGGLSALCDTTILRIPHAAIRGVAARYPAIAEAFWRDCMFDAAVLMQWIVNVGRRDARTRLAHIFCEMAIRCGNDREVLTEYAFPVTQEQLGDAAALTPVHVNRSLKTLKSLMTIRGGHVDIHDWDGLARVGEFDSAYLVADMAPERNGRLLAVA
ncbi:Crp/Fnr family transcriptional regulator [Sphingomonas sp. M1-B02]|uniref:Crp/Fnr family transcriptional regulator n=1 Tax=Sphingomonas sp. M1-B02 TaxID=3114300 RepID=UPI002240A57E|nr:Crp/Fnr family transcriptional regulator [Sphingomonas sp. S6-11]UZK66618.1 Crp/Fnr family transcriptional regulator [Sphingomonas sp. S6-11]